jgi:hypothetical protein|nr:MAG TPA: hypothetical protein [Caudoviricetes sp.]
MVFCEIFRLDYVLVQWYDITITKQKQITKEINIMKELLRKLEAAEQKTSKLELKLDENFEKGIDTEKIEKLFDEAYKKEFELYIGLAKKIEKISNGKINFDTAKKLITERRSELKELLQKIA